MSFNSGPGALAVKAVLGGTLGNGQAGGLSSLSVHISLSEPRIQCTQKENEAPDASPSPNPPPSARSSTLPPTPAPGGHHGHVLTQATGHPGWNKTGILANPWACREP